MNKRAIQAIGLAVVIGMLFLQAIVAGGVASEEMGVVMDAMRELRRADNLYYELYSFTENEKTTQKLWVDLLTEDWIEELSVYDEDGMVVFWRRLFLNDAEWMNDGQCGWERIKASESTPGFDVLTDFSLRVDDIEETECLDENGKRQITFQMSDDALEKQRKAFFTLEADEERMSEITYQQYTDTKYKNGSMTYCLDENGQLTDVIFSMDMTRPDILLNGGKYILGEFTTNHIGYSVTIKKMNDTTILEEIKKCEEEVLSAQ